MDLAHTTAVVSLPGMGDDIQAMKAGILEIGDIFIVNKADKIGSDDVVRHLQVMLEMRDYSNTSWTPPVLKTVASKSEGITELVDAFLEHRDHLVSTGILDTRVEEREFHFFKELVKEMAYEKISSAAGGAEKYSTLTQALKERKTDPYSAAETLMKHLKVDI